MTCRYIARGDNTFDVYDGPIIIGSVWKYGDRWACFDLGYRMVGDGFWPSHSIAAAALIKALT
jgi:hypothetical protein